MILLPKTTAEIRLDNNIADKKEYCFLFFSFSLFEYISRVILK